MGMNKTDDLRADVINDLAGKPGLRGKIDAMCVYCIYDPIGGKGGWRMQVSACTSKVCPLWPIRTKSMAKEKT